MFSAAVVMLLLHSPDGYDVQINPEQVTSLVEERRGSQDHQRLYHKNAHCLVRLADGTQIAVTEYCAEIHKMLETAK